MGFSRENSLNQALDIAGSLTQNQTMTEGDESLGYGASIGGQIGALASVSAFSSNIATISGLTSMSAQSVGRFLTISGANSSGNNGTFLIVNFNSANSVDVSNSSAVSPDSNNGSLIWIERNPYSLEDDINYIRTDRKLIKGTTNWHDSVPTYDRPTAIGTDVDANLTNIAGKTTDAVAYNVNKAHFGQAVSSTNTFITFTSTSNLKHADPIDHTGVPCFDEAPFLTDWNSCYVHITGGAADGYAGSELVVRSGPHAGERIFGLTYNGSSTSPNSVEVHFYSVPYNLNFATSATAYTWEAIQSSVINLLYGYNERLDQLDINALRSIPALGILTDAGHAGTGGGGGPTSADQVSFDPSGQTITNSTNVQDALTEVANAISGGSGFTDNDFLLDNEPTKPNNTYSNTFVSGKLTQEMWVRTADSTLIKTIDYTYLGSKIATEIRKVYNTTGLTIVAEMTITYSYSGSILAGATIVTTGATAADPDFLLDCEPTAPNNTYSNTFTGGKLTQEVWVRTSDSTNIKTIDYNYSGSKISTEIRKVYDSDGITIIGQLTINYTYTLSALTGGIITRDI